MDLIEIKKNEIIPKEKDNFTYLEAATSGNTRKAYQMDVRHFISWGGLLPATPDVLLRYLHHYAESLNPRTLKRRLVALKQWHLYQNFADPTAHPLIRKTMTGILHVHGKPAKKAAILSIEDLIVLHDYLKQKDEFWACRDNALLQIGFFGAFRRSELIAIQCEHLRFSAQGVEILIPRSKTDQAGEGQVCAIPYGNTTLCPIVTLKKWQEIAHIQQGPLFRRLLKGSKIAETAITVHSVNQIIKNVATLCHLTEANEYSGHSLRRGFATSATRNGASFNAIMRQGRWKHEGTVYGYIEEGQRFEANAAKMILEKTSIEKD